MKQFITILFTVFALFSACKPEVKKEVVAAEPFDTAKVLEFGVDLNKHLPVGLNVGDKAPDFELPNQNGELVKLSTVLKDKPVVLFFYRGNWCPACRKHLTKFQADVQLLYDKGYAVMALTAEPQNKLQAVVDSTGVAYNLLSDKELKVAKQFDVAFTLTEDYDKMLKGYEIFLLEHNETENADLPVTATFIMDEDGIITHKFFTYDYKNRATVQQILAELEK